MTHADLADDYGDGNHEGHGWDEFAAHDMRSY